MPSHFSGQAVWESERAEHLIHHAAYELGSMNLALTNVPH